MVEILVILQLSIAAADRDAVLRAAPPTQSISNRVFIATTDAAAVPRLRSMPGVAKVLTAIEPGVRDSSRLDDAEALFVDAWMSRIGQVKARRGDNLDWDTPPMQPPDR
jgi:hypothetical protein